MDRVFGVRIAIRSFIEFDEASPTIAILAAPALGVSCFWSGWGDGAFSALLASGK
jgi:hypothetical protein